MVREEVKGKWSSRKFWSAMFWQGTLTLLIVMERIPASVFESLTFLLLGGYFLSNVAQKRILQK